MSTWYNFNGSINVKDGYSMVEIASAFTYLVNYTNKKAKTPIFKCVEIVYLNNLIRFTGYTSYHLIQTLEYFIRSVLDDIETYECNYNEVISETEVDYVTQRVVDGIFSEEGGTREIDC